MSPGDDRYLWDRSGPIDRDVAALERALEGFRFAPRAAPEERRARWPWSVAIAAGALVGLAIGLVRLREAPPEVLRVARDLAPGEWVEATAAPRRIELRDGIGEVRLLPGGRVRVDRADAERNELFLERGALHAFVAADARPRFFQVRTPTTTCVDLGCQYELRVDEPTGDAHVAVTLGQVAFETATGAVYVPAGAEAFATRSHGLGTPRFRGSDERLVAALDAFDRARGAAPAQRTHAAEVCARAETGRDTLPVWHLLADPDPVVAELAEAALARIAGRPERGGVPLEPGEASVQEWREHVERLWW